MIDYTWLAAVLADSNALLIAARLFVAVLAIVLAWTVFTHHYRIDGLVRFGVVVLWPGIVGALDALIDDRPFLSVGAMSGRWLLVGCGTLIIVVRIWYLATVLVRTQGVENPHARRRVADVAKLAQPRTAP